jgi:hypothetical protein
MNKYLVSIIILAVVAAAFVTTGSVFAHGPNPQSANPGTGLNQAAGRGMDPVQAQNQDGYLNEDLIPFYAEKLGLSVDELNTRLANGETLSQIALASGMTFEELRAMMADARTAALQQSVSAGELTQEQADWMAQRGAGISANGQGRGMRAANAGAGLGQFTNPDCPYATPTE